MVIQELQELIKQLKKWHVVRKHHQIPRRTEHKKTLSNNCTKNTGRKQNMRKEIYSDISARWLKIHNIFIWTSWWNVKLYSTEHNIINKYSRSRYVIPYTHTCKCQKNQELRHTPSQDKAACNTMKSLKVHCKQLIWCKRKYVQNNFQNVTMVK
jgi:hypothetical protein